MAAEPIYRRPSYMVFREEDGAILFNSDDGSVYLLEGVGWALYHHHVDKGATRSEMLDSLRTHYPDQDPAALERDLDAFLADLEKNRCVEKVEK